MSDHAPDPRWSGLDVAFRAAADVVAELDPDPTARRSMLHLIDDSSYSVALLYATTTVRRSDGREAALRLAKLLVPQIELMLDESESPEFASNAMEVDESVAEYEEIIRRLRSVVDAHGAGRAVPLDFRADVETWWDGLKAEGDIDAAIEKAKARLDAPEGGDNERFWLQEILIDWLYFDDQWRWQPALVLLAAGKVQRAVPEMRSAVSYPSDVKAPFAGTFRRYADELEAGTGA